MEDGTHPPLNAPTGFRTGTATAGASCNLLLDVWKDRDSEGRAERPSLGIERSRGKRHLEAMMRIVGGVVEDSGRRSFN